MPNSIQIGRFDNDLGTITPVGTVTAGAPTLAAGINIVPATVSVTAVNLPSFGAGPIVVRNSAAGAFTALVFPPTALGSINGTTAGTSFSVAQNARAIFFPHPNGIDYTAVLSA